MKPAKYIPNNLYNVCYEITVDGKTKQCRAHIQAMGEFEIKEALNDTQSPDGKVPRKLVSYEKIEGNLILSRMTLDQLLNP